ncbi:hypothetical protein ACIQVN_31665 [Streptomyces cyaneofuscatus]|uniref:hypothetical protein n=1 Tax=Streptomyces cyaneofuscatus TaxID=66883 RepID=UPI00380F4665
MLSKPPLSSGDRDLAALAVLASTSAQNLHRALGTSSSAPITVKPSPERTDAENAEAALFFDIQREARGRGLTVRTLAARHNVSRRTVRRALNAAPASTHDTLRRRSLVVDPDKHLIDPLLDQGLPRGDVWDRLVDDHDVVLSWTALATTPGRENSRGTAARSVVPSPLNLARP